MSSSGTPTPHLGLNQWLPNDKPERADFNSDNLKIETHMNSISQFGVAETYTVNMADLQTLINSLPKLLTKNITINVNAGTLNSALTITNFYGNGSLFIYGASTTSAETHMCTNVLIQYCAIPYIYMQGITATNTSGAAFFVRDSWGTHVYLNTCNATSGASSTSNHIGIDTQHSHILLVACTISSKASAIRANGSVIRATGLFGTGNAIIYQAIYGGQIYVRAFGSIAGTTLMAESIGGQVIMPSTYGTNNDTAIAYGKYAMGNVLNAAPNYNVAVGTYSMQNATGTSNTAVGYSAGRSVTSGIANTAVGESALTSNTTGNFNTAMGQVALFKNTTGEYNTAIGRSSLYENTTGHRNVAIGREAVRSNIFGSDNIGIGYAPGYNNPDGSSNIMIGTVALRHLTSGSNNIAIGYSAGDLLSDGTGQAAANTSIFIGNTCRGSSSNAQSNQIVIGYNAIGYGSNTAHIGNTSVGSISYGAATGTAFTNRSDPRIKEDIQDADLDTCVDRVKNLPLHYFKYKDFVGNEGDQHVLGFLSTEFSEVLPKAVHRNTMTFDERDEDGNVIYETKIVDEYVDEEVEVEVKTLKEIIDPDTGDTLIITRIKTQTEMRPILKQIEKEVPKQIIIEDCESIDSSQLVPILWGAVQQLVAKVEKLEARINE